MVLCNHCSSVAVRSIAVRFKTFDVSNTLFGESVVVKNSVLFFLIIFIDVGNIYGIIL